MSKVQLLHSLLEEGDSMDPDQLQQGFCTLYDILSEKDKAILTSHLVDYCKNQIQDMMGQYQNHPRQSLEKQPYDPGISSGDFQRRNLKKTSHYQPIPTINQKNHVYSPKRNVPELSPIHIALAKREKFLESIGLGNLIPKERHQFDKPLDRMKTGKPIQTNHHSYPAPAFCQESHVRKVSENPSPIQVALANRDNFLRSIGLGHLVTEQENQLETFNTPIDRMKTGKPIQTNHHSYPAPAFCQENHACIPERKVSKTRSIEEALAQRDQFIKELGIYSEETQEWKDLNPEPRSDQIQSSEEPIDQIFPFDIEGLSAPFKAEGSSHQDPFPTLEIEDLSWDHSLSMPFEDEDTNNGISESCNQDVSLSYGYDHEDYLIPLGDQNAYLESSEESISLCVNPSLEIPLNEVSLNSLEDVHEEIPQVIFEESPLEEPLDCPCPIQSMNIEIHEPNVTSLGYDDSINEMLELGDQEAFLPSMCSQEPTIFTEYSLNHNDHDRDFLVNPICNTSEEGSILNNILDHQSLGEELDLEKVGSHLHILESPKDSTLERDTYDGSENLFSVNLGETFEDHYHLHNQDQIILEHLPNSTITKDEGVDHLNLGLEFLDKELENFNYMDPHASYLSNVLSPSSIHVLNTFTWEICIGENLSIHPSHPSSTSDSSTLLNSHHDLEDYIHPISVWIEDSCTTHPLPWYLASSISYDHFLDPEVSSLVPSIDHNERFVNLLREWLHFIFDFT